MKPLCRKKQLLHFWGKLVDSVVLYVNSETLLAQLERCYGPAVRDMYEINAGKGASTVAPSCCCARTRPRSRGTNGIPVALGSGSISISWKTFVFNWCFSWQPLKFSNDPTFTLFFCHNPLFSGREVNRFLMARCKF